jgi:hypothetical protein
MLGVLRTLATAETVMKHIVSQVIDFTDGMAAALTFLAVTPPAVTPVLAI